MRTIRLILEYDGTNFSGWQIQDEDHFTVQAALQQAIEKITKEKVRVRGASRTDAGVHARGQVVAFDTEKDDVPLVGFERGLVTYLPNAVVVRKAEEVEQGWDPRRTSRGKRYRYTYWVDRQPSAIDRHFAWFVRGTLDLEKMQAAAQHLIGTHDFSAFRSAGCVARHAVRKLYHVEVSRGLYSRVYLDVIGNAFVKNMVRIIAGNLKEVGEGRLAVDDVRTILEGKDRTRGGMTAPAHGLCLEEVIYDDRLPPRPKDDVDLQEDA